jgi:hypothetical protein
MLDWIPALPAPSCSTAQALLAHPFRRLGRGFPQGRQGRHLGRLPDSDAHGRRYPALGTADDVADPDSVHVLSVTQAQEVAGCWFAELARQDRRKTSTQPYTVADAMAGYVAAYQRKGGKAWHVALSAEGIEFFRLAVTGKAASDLIFRRATGSAWNHADQFRPLRDACKTARIEPAIGFHILRHTYGSRLAMRGVPLAVIAAQFGHADTRMTERHYAHLAPSYVADTARAAFGAMRLVSPSNLVPLANRRPG